MKAPIDSEQVDQLEEDLYEFLSNYGARINTDDEKVRRCVERLAIESIKSSLDSLDDDGEDDILEFSGSMDQFGFEDDDV